MTSTKYLKHRQTSERFFQWQLQTLLLPLFNLSVLNSLSNNFCHTPTWKLFTGKLKYLIQFLRRRKRIITLISISFPHCYCFSAIFSSYCRLKIFSPYCWFVLLHWYGHSMPLYTLISYYVFEVNLINGNVKLLRFIGARSFNILNNRNWNKRRLYSFCSKCKLLQAQPSEPLFNE